MLETPEARAKLRRKLESWPDDRKSPVTINQGLELLDMVERLEKEIAHSVQTINDWRRRFRHRGTKIKSLKSRIRRLEKEADWFASKCAAVCQLSPYVPCEEKCPLSCSCSDYPFLAKHQRSYFSATVADWREAASKAVEEQCEK